MSQHYEETLFQSKVQHALQHFPLISLQNLLQWESHIKALFFGSTEDSQAWNRL